MKPVKLLAFYLLLFCVPILSRAQLISGAEYFYDTDPGVGHATAITISTPADSVNLNLALPTTSLSAGFHSVYTRFKYSNGEWGLYEGRSFYLLPSGTSGNSPQLTAAEYFFDLDPGIGQGTPINIGSATDSSNLLFTVNTTGLLSGFHILYIRYQYTGGVWGLYEGRSFYIIPTGTTGASPELSAAEYFFDLDPGVGGGTPINIGAASDSSNILFTVNTTGLASGFHLLYIRYKYTSGQWGLYEGRSFYVIPPGTTGASPQLSAAEYFFDTDPGVGQGTAINIGATNDSSNIIFNVNTTGLSSGFHLLYVRYKYTDGQWGLDQDRSFFIIPTGTTGASPQLNAMEYFFDTDPGVGLGTPLPISPATDSSDMIINCPATGLAQGTHYLYIRYRYVDGTYGLYQGATFDICNPPPAQITASGDTSFCLGASLTLHSNTADTLTYQWQRNGIAITDSVNSSLTITDSSGFYTVLIIDTTGCTATSNGFHVTIQQPVFTNISAAICPTSTYNFNGHIVSSAGQYHDTLSVSDACDSIITLTLSILPTPTTNLSATICPGSTYNFNGHILSTGGTYRDTLTAVNTCDSFVILTLTLSSIITTNLSATICTGVTYPFNGQNLSIGGTYRDTVLTGGGCDSVTILTLTVNPPITNNISASICTGGSYTFNGQILTTAGTYRDTLLSSSDCDSINVLILTVSGVLTTNISASICTGGSYPFNGQNLTVAGTYRDTVPSSGGCDSVTILALTVNPPINNSISASVCTGGSYNFNGQILTTAGTYRDTLITGGGCDSINILTLTFSGVLTTNISASICAGSSYNFNGQNLTASGTYRDTVMSSGGCDSVTILALTVNPPIMHNINASVCTGGSYNFNGEILTTAGTYRDTLIIDSGCDSINILTLTFSGALTTNINASICSGGSYSFSGQNLNATGIYADTLISSGGCDSIVTLNLIVNGAIVNPINASICSGSSYLFNGQNLTSAGTYRDTLITGGGCDSIVILTLSVNQPSSQTINANVCSGSGYNFNGTILTESGTYVDTLITGGGCDSIVTLNLVVGTYVNLSDSVAVCQGLSYYFHGHYIFSAGTYTDTVPSQGNCDTIVTLTLTVNPSPTVTWNQQNIMVCLNAGPVFLTASPWGGVYSGAGINGTNFYPDSAGVGTHPITYSYTNIYNCNSGTSKTFTVLDTTNVLCTTGITGVGTDGMIQLYPNPTNDLLIMQSPLFAAVEIRPLIYDITGKAMSLPFSREVNGLSFHTATLAVGMYWIRFELDGVPVSLKFVKTD